MTTGGSTPPSAPQGAAASALATIQSSGSPQDNTLDGSTRTSGLAVLGTDFGSNTVSLTVDKEHE